MIAIHSLARELNSAMHKPVIHIVIAQSEEFIG